jgi:hypothetical protein
MKWGPSIHSNQQQEKTQFQFENVCEEGSKQARRQKAKQASDLCGFLLWFLYFCELTSGKSWHPPRRHFAVCDFASNLGVCTLTLYAKPWTNSGKAYRWVLCTPHSASNSLYLTLFIYWLTQLKASHKSSKSC